VLLGEIIGGKDFTNSYIYLASMMMMTIMMMMMTIIIIIIIVITHHHHHHHLCNADLHFLNLLAPEFDI
jgi:uncharacterized membrane protein